MISFKRPVISLYYLNYYPHEANPVRIESTRGPRVLWRERTSFSRMAVTKKYIESVWTH